MTFGAVLVEDGRNILGERDHGGRRTPSRLPRRIGPRRRRWQESSEGATPDSDTVFATKSSLVFANAHPRVSEPQSLLPDVTKADGMKIRGTLYRSDRSLGSMRTCLVRIVPNLSPISPVCDTIRSIGTYMTHRIPIACTLHTLIAEARCKSRRVESLPNATSATATRLLAGIITSTEHLSVMTLTFYGFV